MVSVSHQAADLKSRRKKLGEEEDEVDRQIVVRHMYQKRDYIHLSVHLATPWFPHLCVCLQALPRLIQERDQLKEELERLREEKHQARALIQRAREERDGAKEEEERLRKDRGKAIEESRRTKVEKERLESKVSLLQERCDRLSCRVRYSFLNRTSVPSF